MPKEKEDKDDLDVIEKLKAKYSLLQTKYDLPPFDDLDKEFELYLIDEYSTNMMKEVRRQMSAVINSMSAFISPVLTPSESDIHSLIESEGIKKDVKAKMSIFFNKLHYISHKGIVASLTGEKETAAFVKEVWKEWPAIKKELIGYAQKLTEVWAKVKNERTDVGYLG